jgi:DNA-binding LacI/PurR family transcriptional regulator
VADATRRAVVSGAITAGDLLPSERTLAAKHAVDKMTVRRGLKALEAEGLIEAIDRHGYRVKGGAADPLKGCTIAFLPHETEDAATWRANTQVLLPPLQAFAGRQGWSFLTIPTKDRTPHEIVLELKSHRAGGILLDSSRVDLVRAVRACGIPAVLIEDWIGDVDIDSVMQDGQLGGRLAVQYLAGKGCRRMAWFGPAVNGAHTFDRFSGVAAALNELNLQLEPGLTIKSDHPSDDPAARALLERPDRPDGIVAAWTGHAAALIRAGRALGLREGHDFHLVGWSPEETFDSLYRAAFESAPVPPAVTWSARVLAETAMGRLSERRFNPDLPAVRVKIAMVLKPAPGAESKGDRR